MNEVLKVLETRRACRKFKPDMITDEELQAIIKAGTYAPNGMGRQAGLIIAVTNPELIKKLSKANAEIAGMPEGTDPFYGAPVVLIVLANKDVRTYVYDGALVMGNLMNAAASLGVASIWIHRAKQEFEAEIGQEILKDLGIEGEWEGIGHCCLGYAVEPAKEGSPRKENFVYYIK